MERLLALELDTFGTAALEQSRSRLGMTAGEVLEVAIGHYLTRAAGDSPPPSLPKFASPRGDASRVEIEVSMPAGRWQEFEAAGARDAADPDALAVHALMVLAADLSSGRVASEVLRAAEDELAG